MKRKIILGRPLTSFPADSKNEIILDLDGYNKGFKNDQVLTDLNIEEIINKIKKNNTNK